MNYDYVMKPRNTSTLL